MRNRPCRRRVAFTLVEMLVVIAVIAILAGLLFAVMPAVGGARVTKTARAELTQIQTAIEAFKAHYGFYPPSAVNSRTDHPLYLELVGTVLAPPAFNTYQTLDGSYSVSMSLVTNQFRIGGLVNSSTSRTATDEKAAPENFLKELKPTQIGLIGSGVNQVRTLALSADPGVLWNYNSANPTNNPGGYDLWVWVQVGDKTNLVSNWNQ